MGEREREPSFGKVYSKCSYVQANFPQDLFSRKDLDGKIRTGWNESNNNAQAFQQKFSEQ